MLERFLLLILYPAEGRNMASCSNLTKPLKRRQSLGVIAVSSSFVFEKRKKEK